MKLQRGAVVDESVRCPACRSNLVSVEGGLECVGDACRRHFPIVDGVPILIDNDRSIFSTGDYRPATQTVVRKQGLGRFLPAAGISPRTAGNFAQFHDLLLKACDHPRILVVGGRVVGQGMDGLLADTAIQAVETDIVVGPRTQIVCDGHSLPFADNSFDGVVIQAVLEHVADPSQCVEEIHRVLKLNGLVYAETPFMQQVHGGAFDFTRYTALGHRRLFRNFDEVASGACGGPAMAFIWSYEYLLGSLPRSRRGRQAAKVVSRLTSSWLKHLDRIVIDRPAALDAASGVFFLGTRSEHAITDRELIRQYRGIQGFVAEYPMLA